MCRQEYSIVNFLGKYIAINCINETSIINHFSKTYRINKKQISLTKCGEFFQLRILQNGGKGGFGRAMKEEGRRRSKRLPPFKDACRTLSGKRIMTIKAKRRVKEIQERINAIKIEQKEAKELVRKSNAEKELQLLQEREEEGKKLVEESVKFGITAQHEKPKASNVLIDANDFDELDNL